VAGRELRRVSLTARAPVQVNALAHGRARPRRSAARSITSPRIQTKRLELPLATRTQLGACVPTASGRTASDSSCSEALLLRNAPPMPYGDDCVYGSVPMPYRNPESRFVEV
jgi:hypothetical protein